MQTLQAPLHRWRRLAALAFAAGMSGCGSAFGTNAPSLPPAPALPVSADFAQTRIVAAATSPGGGTVTLPLPPSAGYAGTAAVSLPQIPAGLRFTITYRNTPPAGLAPLAATRTAAALRSARDVLSTDVLYACVAANMAVSIDGTPRFTFLLPASFADERVRYFAAVWQNAKWIDGYGGPATPATVNGSAQVTIDGRYGFTLAPNVPVCVSLFGRWSTAPTPTPAVIPAGPTASPSASPSPAITPTSPPTNAPSATPTSAPTATPTNAPTPSSTSTPTSAPTPSPTPGAPTASAASLSFAALGSSYAQTFTMTESAYGGTWSESDTCAGRVTVTATGNTHFRVTPNAVGACTITMSDSFGASTAIAVDITSSTIGVQ